MTDSDQPVEIDCVFDLFNLNQNTKPGPSTTPGTDNISYTSEQPSASPNSILPHHPSSSELSYTDPNTLHSNNSSRDEPSSFIDNLSLFPFPLTFSNFSADNMPQSHELAQSGSPQCPPPTSQSQHAGPALSVNNSTNLSSMISTPSVPGYTNPNENASSNLDCFFAIFPFSPIPQHIYQHSTTTRCVSVISHGARDRSATAFVINCITFQFLIWQYDHAERKEQSFSTT